jgi:hypothetical protein
MSQNELRMASHASLSIAREGSDSSELTPSFMVGSQKSPFAVPPEIATIET